MSRNGSGVYSLPAGSTVTNGDTSDASDLNTPLADIEADLNVARPIVAGGTGATSASAALVNLGLTATAAEINVLDGVTASTAELNILDGVTATTTEINYIDGVTSAIQTQLNAKQAQNATLQAIADEGSTIDLQTAVTLTSQQEVDFTGIPATARRITVIFNEVSTDGTAVVSVQLGDSGGFETTGYTSTVMTGSTTSLSHASQTSAFRVHNCAAADIISGMMVLSKVSGNLWVCSGSAKVLATSTVIFNGSKTLSDTLTQVRIQAEGGVRTFDTGSITVSWE